MAQTTGMEFIGPLTFTNIRFLIGGLIVLPFVFNEINKIKNGISLAKHKMMNK